jgi:DNA repair protein RecO (recombination protein O)
MLPCHVTPAIVLRTWAFGESDKIVSFLTESHGKLTGIAKGAKRSRKRFVNSLEPFSLVNLRFHDRAQGNLVFIIASDLVFGFKHLLTSLEKISFASYLVEITDGLIGEREENRLIFRHLKDGLTHLEEQSTMTLTFLTAFELKLLKLAGYQPWLESCRRCGRERRDRCVSQWHFSPRDGGILCESCSRMRKEIFSLSAATLEMLTNLQEEKSMPPPDVSPPTLLKEIRSVVVRFIEFHMEREIKSAAFLHQFSLA